MKKLFTLDFRRLPFPAHFDYFMKLSTLLSSAGDSLKAAIAALMADFDTWMDREDTVMRWIRKSALTEQIAEADRQIDRLLVGIGSIVQAALHSPSEVIMAAANSIHIMLKQYGNVAHEAYDEEAGDVRAILEQFKGKYAEDVNTVGLTTWVGELSAAFNNFESLLRQRETEQSAKPPYTAQDVRKGIEKVYAQMAEIINANSVVGTSEDFAAFIDLLNPDIERLNAEFARVLKDLGRGGHTVIEPVETQKYTEKPVTPIPKAYYREDGKPTVELVFGKDFSVTYKNNVNVGAAEATIHGKGRYKGTKTVTFNIAR
jgi:hypothetical protein